LFCKFGPGIFHLEEERVKASMLIAPFAFFGSKEQQAWKDVDSLERMPLQKLV